MITNYYIMIGKEVQYRGRLLKSSHLKDLFCKQIMVEKNKKITLKSTISEGFWSDIKSASDRVYHQQRVFLPQRVAQKLRRINNEISPGVTLPILSTSEKCVVTAKTHS